MPSISPEKMSPRMRRISLITSKIALINSTILIPVPLIAAAVILLTRAGNFPTMSDRVLAASFFCFFSLMAFVIRCLTRQRIRRLHAVMNEDAPS